MTDDFTPRTTSQRKWNDGCSSQLREFYIQRLRKQSQRWRKCQVCLCSALRGTSPGGLSPPTSHQISLSHFGYRLFVNLFIAHCISVVKTDVKGSYINNDFWQLRLLFSSWSLITCMLWTIHIGNIGWEFQNTRESSVTASIIIP